MAFDKKPSALAVAIATGSAPAPEQKRPECADCRHYRVLVGRKLMRPEDVPAGADVLPVCWEEDSRRAIPAKELRADVDGCGPDGDWFVQRLVVMH